MLNPLLIATGATQSRTDLVELTHCYLPALTGVSLIVFLMA